MLTPTCPSKKVNLSTLQYPDISTLPHPAVVSRVALSPMSTIRPDTGRWCLPYSSKSPRRCRETNLLQAFERALIPPQSNTSRAVISILLSSCCYLPRNPDLIPYCRVLECPSISPPPQVAWSIITRGASTSQSLGMQRVGEHVTQPSRLGCRKWLESGPNRSRCGSNYVRLGVPNVTHRCGSVGKPRSRCVWWRHSPFRILLG